MFDLNNNFNPQSWVKNQQNTATIKFGDSVLSQEGIIAELFVFSLLCLILKKFKCCWPIYFLKGNCKKLRQKNHWKTSANGLDKVVQARKNYGVNYHKQAHFNKRR